MTIKINIYIHCLNFAFQNAEPTQINQDCSWAPIFVNSSNFKLPAEPKVPIIMICVGTGLTPIRGFLQERFALWESGTELGLSILLFSCRNCEVVICVYKLFILFNM
ncbi:hypothetical protein L1987_19453 [Smallanthus sonchifolius]|uniref:Uncharacterized protein n=1 Tax=Smallanthus sonchifolius TaxID=185202 RepID=A0ACB9IQU8_9ASTR|nr:hypothetical protein L1987_19453 [Smallanthus sonchifolius]